MALSNYILSNLLGRDWWDSWEYPLRIADQHFGMGLTPEDLLVAPVLHPPVGYVPLRCPARRREGGGISQVKNEGDKFEIQLDVRHFSPQEMEVKTVDNFVVIHGKHEEKCDEHGFVTREFTRRYMLPEGVQPDTVTSSLTADGILTVQAPRKKPELPAKDERVVPIQMKEGAAAVTQAEGNKEAAK